MLPESVVDALGKVHRSLVPGGLAVDAHPTVADTTIRLLVHDGDERERWSLPYAEPFIRNIANAETAFTRLVDDGTFLLGRTSTYDVGMLYTTPDDWIGYWAEQAVYYVPPAQERLDSLVDWLGSPLTRVIHDMQVTAVRYVRPA